MKLSRALVAFVASCGPEGATRAQIREAMGITCEDFSGLTKHLRKSKKLLLGGPRRFGRYFADQAHLDAWMLATNGGEDVKKTAMAASSARRKEGSRQRHRRNAEAKRATRPPKPINVELPRTGNRPFDQAVIKIAPVVIAKPKKDAVIVIPPGLKITQCPSAWKDKPLPDPDAAIPKREGAEDWRKCGRLTF